MLTPFQIVGYILLYFTEKSILVVHISRFLTLLVYAAIFQIFLIYISEIVEPKIRGLSIALVTVVWNIALIYVNLVGAYFSFETSSLLLIIFPILFLFLFSFVPKSPYYLIMKGNLKEAEQALLKLRGGKKVQVIQEEFTQLVLDVKRQISEKGSIKDIFSDPDNRKACLITIALYEFETISGHGALVIFAQSFFLDATSLLSKETAAAAMAALQMVCVFISMFMVDRVGRKFLVLVSFAAISISLFFLSAYFLVKDFYWESIQDYSWIFIVFVVIFNAFFNIGIAPVVPCIKTELLPLKFKGVGTNILCATYTITTFGITSFYQYMATYYSIGWPLLFFAFMQLLAFVVTWMFLPETKGRTLEEIQQTLKRH